MSTRLDAYEAGIKMRSKVLGAAHVGRSVVAEDDFSAPVQQFVTEVGWGNVWSRGGLDLKSRSMITVAMLAAIGSEHELAVHIRGALNRSCSRLGCTQARPQRSRRSVLRNKPCNPSTPTQVRPIRPVRGRALGRQVCLYVQEERTGNAAGNNGHTGNRHQKGRLGQHDWNDR